MSQQRTSMGWYDDEHNLQKLDNNYKLISRNLLFVRNLLYFVIHSLFGKCTLSAVSNCFIYFFSNKEFYNILFFQGFFYCWTLFVIHTTPICTTLKVTKVPSNKAISTEKVAPSICCNCLS